MSFYTSLSGLKAAQTDLSVTSNNVANVGTIGFKKSNTEFGDIISSAPLQSSAMAGQGTRLRGIQQQFTQGGFESSDRSLDVAISGQGFFVTKAPGGAGQISYTRNGSFTVNKERYVTDGSGAVLQVLPTDKQGTVTATSLSSAKNLQLPLTTGSSKATQNLSMTVALPSDADLPADRAAYASTTYAFSRSDPESYNYSTATTVYDAAGTAVPATVYYTRTAAPTASDPNSKWEARLFVGDKEVSSDGNAAADPATPLTLTFDSSGALTTPTGAVDYAAVLPTGASSAIDLSFDYGSGTTQGLTAFSRKATSQDGYAAGQLDNISVGSDGLVTATFSNGESQALGKLMLATFANPEGLRQLGDAKWSATGLSGEPIVNEAGANGMGSIQSGALEQANVDVTEELVSLISAQRNFSANAKAIETANNMTQTIVQLRS